MPKNILAYFSIVILVILLFRADVKYTSSDPQLTLLTSQAIIENGSINLKVYKDALGDANFSEGDWKYLNYVKEGKVYYMYPLGSSIFSIPIVFVAQKFGLNMAIFEHDAKVQKFIAGLLLILIFIIHYKTAILFFERNQAAIITLLFFLGSSYLSTVGLALWSFDFEILFISLIFYDLIAKLKINKGFLNPSTIGILFFLAWFCRPSALISIIVYTAFFIYWNRSIKAYLPIFAGMIIPFALFSAWSLNAYGSVVPPYYDPFFWEKSAKQFSLFESILLVLFSPARGLMIYSPYLLILIPLALFFLIKNRNKILVFSFVVAALYIVLIANQSNWWGGWCYGSRLTTDALPAIFLITLISINDLMKLHLVKFKRILITFLLFFSASGIYIQTYQGLFNTYIFWWNDSPPIDSYIKYYAWNWDFMPFFANDAQLKSKENDFKTGEVLTLYTPKLKDGSSLLFYRENLESNYLVINNLNRRKNFENLKLFSSIQQIENLMPDSFYAPYFLQWELDHMNDYQIFYPKTSYSLGKFVKLKRNSFVVLVLKDEGSTSLSTESKELFKEMGSQLDSLKFQQGYVGVFKDGKLISESFELEKPAEIRFDRPNWYVYAKSIGMKNGNLCKIEINSVSYQKELRGFQVIEINENGEIMDKQYFDTFCNDGSVTDLLLLKNKKFVN